MKNLLWTLAFAGAICAGAQVEVPLGPVPFILSDYFVLLAGLVLGPWRGLLAVALYLALGAAGLPVYAGGAGGWAHLTGPTGGFLIGFALAAFVAGQLSHAGAFRIWRDLLATISGQATFFALGLLWLAWRTDMPWAEVLSKGLYPFAFPILLKWLGAGLLAGPLRRLIRMA